MPRPSASATASRFAAHWVADAIAADDAIDFSSVTALLDASPESLAGAPESVSERVALRCLQELSAATTTGDGPTTSRAPAGMLRVDITRSCEDLLLQIIGEVGSSGSLRKDMLPAFSQDIQNIICIKKPRLPETCFELLREVDREIACVQVIRVPALDRSSDVLQTNPSDAGHLLEFTTGQDTTMIPQVDSSRTHLSSPQHNGGENANQDLDYEGTSIQSVEKDSIHEGQALHAGSVLPSVRCNGAIQGDKSETNHLLGKSKEHPALYEQPNDGNCHLVKDSIHEGLALRAGSVLPSVRCNGAIQGDKSETNHLLGKSKEHPALYEQPNDGNCHLEDCCADKVNQCVFTDGGILEKNMAVCGGLNVQSASGPRSCSVALHNKISEDNYLCGEKNAKRTTDVQKLSCSVTVPIPPQDGDGRRQISSKETLANTLVETSHVHFSDDSLSGSADKMPFCIKDQGTNSSPRGCSEKDLCIKCGKDGQLRKCNSCLLAAHKSCFGPTVTFEDSGEFCCPVCFYTKATEAYKEAKKTYCEARKNLAAFLGSQQLVNQHDEQPPEVLPRASPSQGHLNGCNLVKRKNSHQTETNRLACSGEKADQQRKKQKRNAITDACHEEAVTGKVPSVRNSGVEPVNKHSVFQSISKQVHDAQKEQEVENAEAREEAGNGNSCDRMRNRSHEKGVPSATNQEVEADRGDGLTNCNESENSGETEAISLSDSGQRSLPTSHNSRHHKARLQERETTVSCNSGKAFVQQSRHMPSPSRKRNYAYPINRPSGPVAPTGRRSKISWTDEEEAALREAMEKFDPQDNRPIPWVQMLEYGRDVFHRARLPCDLRVKWRNMMKKAGS